MYLETKDFDFGQPGVKKRVYYIDVTYGYRSDDENASVKIYTHINNSSETVPSTNVGMLDAYQVEGLMPTSTPTSFNWVTKRMYFNPNQYPITVKSLSVVIEAVGYISGFKLNDISITARGLNR